MKHLFVARRDHVQQHLGRLGGAHWIDLPNGECVVISARPPPPELQCHRAAHVLRGASVGHDFAAKLSYLGVLPAHTTLDAVEVLGRINPLFNLD
ncbi:MAG: hypothetical protein QJR02_11825 [Sinobacteraceae bacterium]|nr:hypothetical protein [Nevskiaceae bacterium]